MLSIIRDAVTKAIFGGLIPELIYGVAAGYMMAVLVWGLTPELRRRWLWSVLILALFLGLDGVVLASLPVWGISYGDFKVSLWAVWGVRIAVFLGSGALGGMMRVGFKRVRIQRFADQLLALTVVLNFILSAGLIYCFCVEPFSLGVTRLEVPFEKPGSAVRIVQLSDLHVERTTARERALIPLLDELKPDLIVLTGDYLNYSYLDDPAAAADLRALFSQLHAPYGVYMVNGTTESPVRAAELIQGLPEITLLNDEVRAVEVRDRVIYLVGVSNIDHGGLQDANKVGPLMQGVPAEEMSVLLYHMPDLMESAAASGVDLYLAGHTHGGQIRLPLYGALLTFSRYGKQYEQGVYTSGSTRLYVSRGLGLEGAFAPRARFLCPPEIVVVDLLNQE